MHQILALVRVLSEMNRAFGKGEIGSVTIDVRDSDDTVIVGQADCGGSMRFFKVENETVTFLSRRRKLK